MLDRLFGRKTADDRRHTRGDASGPAECPHGALTPRWDRIEDMGHDDRTSSFVCDSCHQALTPVEAEQARRAAAERLRRG
ncbi:MAG: hypothetical protein O2822_03365 [Chloroflexi bacterium]|nr:hypothetical protein [Chloroflexota bacterium]